MINFKKVRAARTHEEIAARFPVVREAWELEFPLVEPGPGEPVTGKLSDFVKFVSLVQLRKQIKHAGWLADVSRGMVWRYCGDNRHRFLSCTHAEILALILKDENLIMGDASGRAGGNHWQHERGWGTLDLDYPVFGSEGTHYGREFGIVEIWKDADHRVIDLEVFDKEKTIRILTKIRGAFPKARIFVSDTMREILDISGLIGDNNAAWHHWLHTHIELGFYVNWDWEL